MDLGLRGRVALVCAASQGLGKAAALGFAREGAHVVICSRQKKALTLAADEIRAAVNQSPVQVVPVVADLTKPRQVAAVVARAMKLFGRIDVLVTNAGGPPVGAFADLDDATWEKGMALTLMSTVRCIRAVLPHMQKRKWGRIINITSIAAKQPINDLIISSSLRPGILGLSRVLASQYAKEGILINSVAPGFMRTARMEQIGATRAREAGITMDDFFLKQSRDIPMQRYGEPEELANVIVFLGSERASYLTGSTVSVDGGLMKGLF
jgi:3-oxoacyl-[acyl-carrier protein] reductase